jgi:hypothetical protein
MRKNKKYNKEGKKEPPRHCRSPLYRLGIFDLSAKLHFWSNFIDFLLALFILFCCGELQMHANECIYSLQN